MLSQHPWGRPARATQEVTVPCRLKLRGTRPCSSTVGGSFSDALEVLGGMALLPPKVAPEDSDILSLTGSLGGRKGGTERKVKPVAFVIRTQKQGDISVCDGS